MIEAGSGSTIEVAAGTYEVDTSLVALRPLTVVGAGADDTTITSTATGAAIVIGVAGTIAITGVPIPATAPGASVVAVTRGGLDLDAVTITGATRDDAGAGGFGLVLAPDGGTGTGRHAVTASTFRDNGGVAIVDDVSITGSAPGGIGVLEQAAPTIAGGTIDLDGEVAVLFGNTAGGTVDGTTITGARIGLQTSGGHDVRDVDCEIIDSTEPA